MDVRPFLHQHYLLFDEYDDQETTCDRCNQQIHHGWAYNCERCNFWLHSACAEQQLPPQISHHPHYQHPLTLYLDASDFICEACSTLSGGHRYICKDCNFIIEVLCASNTKDDVLEKQKYQRSDDSYKTIKHFIHHHSLTLFQYRKVGSDHHRCNWCDKFLSRMCYGCYESECWEEYFFVHESFLLSIPTTILKHPFHPKHPLYIQSVINISKAYSNACKGKIKKNAYNCRQCNFWLHFLCATRQPSLKHEVHDHYLSYFEIRYSRIDYYCKICDKKICDKYGKSAFYRFVQCNFNFHLSCVPIPLTVEVLHPLHPEHPLRFIAIGDEFLCDECRDFTNGFNYVCFECNFTL